MYGVAVEYDVRRGELPDPLERMACQAAMARCPGYRQRLALAADGWRRVVDLFLFASPEQATAALTDEAWGAFVATHPSCRDVGPALLVSKGHWGESVILLRGKSGLTRGGQSCWRDQLANTEPEVILW